MAALATGGIDPPAGLRAQPAATKDAGKSQSAATDAVSLRRYVPSENLVVYMEFAGLDAHASSWKNTAACKMLDDTPLGEMLTEVSAQLLDKALEFFPNHKVSGAEIVKLIKHATRAGWVLAINVAPKGQDACRGTIVLRGAASKELRPISGRLMGWLMGDVKPKIEQKSARTVIVVPGAAAKGAAGGVDTGWVWWAEKDDLVVGFFSPGKRRRHHRRHRRQDAQCGRPPAGPAACQIRGKI